MELGALTSLAEVGISINLGLSLLVQVKDGLSTALSGCVDTLSARCALRGEQAFLFPRALVASLKTIEKRHATVQGWINTAFTVVALGAASVLILFLWCVAQRNQTKVSSNWATWILGLGIGPALTAVLLQVLLFSSAWLWIQTIDHIIGLALQGVPIEPSIVTSEGPPPNGAPSATGDSQPES